MLSLFFLLFLHFQIKNILKSCKNVSIYLYIDVVSHRELKVGVVLHFSNISPWSSVYRKGIDSLTRADTDNRLTDDLTYYIISLRVQLSLCTQYRINKN